MSKIFFPLISLLALAFGLAFIVAPDKFGDLIGLGVSDALSAMGRMMGAAMLAWGLILWSARDFDDAAQTAVLRATGLADAIGAASAFVASVSGTMNVFGFVIAAIFVVVAMACVWALPSRAQRSNVVGDDSRGVFDRLIA